VCAHGAASVRIYTTFYVKSMLSLVTVLGGQLVVHEFAKRCRMRRLPASFFRVLGCGLLVCLHDTEYVKGHLTLFFVYAYGAGKKATDHGFFFRTGVCFFPRLFYDARTVRGHLAHKHTLNGKKHGL